MKRLLWELNKGNSALLIDPKDVHEEVYTEGLLVVEGINDDQWPQILEVLSAKEEQDEDFTIRFMDTDDFEIFLEEELGIEASIQDADEWMEPDETTLFDKENVQVWKANELEKTKVYEWWDGSNWRKVILESYMTETVIEITEKSVCLDEWDGRNWQTGGTGLHQYVHKVIMIDGKKTEDMFLLVHSSQWQGSHDTGELMTVDELRYHLHHLKRDVEKYLYEIGTLSGE
ncbi:hypothetical protein [Parageobacillus galactosidasius]|uniref:Uncharacterized protein n=1 Tax=Parageobacillus galactosidasius TaxID=883812 RepID=A0A226QT40_9BACL|nr:hypothetical protein [Parageobacillus galactosidasius]OXB94857.1 hypothetical protein B9L23_08320 [Parageobacillus galactosidasius]